MRGPKPPAVTLGVEERRELAALVRGHSTPQQVARRARIVLAAADGQNNTQIARALGIEADTARLWRARWLALAPLAEPSAAERLEDAPRSGGPCRITAEQVCGIVALACEAPGQSGRPISHTRTRVPAGREVAAEAVKRGIVPAISPRHAGRLLTRGTSSPTASATG